MTTAPGSGNAQPNVLAGDESHNKWDLADHEHVTLEAIYDPREAWAHVLPFSRPRQPGPFLAPRIGEPTPCD